jgi:phosphatidate cytidylyltransferase
MVEKLFQPAAALDHQLTTILCALIMLVLLVTGLAILVTCRRMALGEPMRKELVVRYLSWLVIVPCIVVPILIGPGSTMIFFTLLGLACFAEFARVTGFFRHRLLTALVVLAILATAFATLDHYYDMFVAMPALAVTIFAAAAIFGDKPKGYLQRVSLASIGFMLFGFSLMHLGYIANDLAYRPFLLLVIICVCLNDVLAFCFGKWLGKRRLAPQTSPGKTIEGAVGASACTALLFTAGCSFIFTQGPLAHWLQWITMGLVLAVAALLGDLVLSSIKRDVGVKDIGQIIPGHGGLLDRFDSLLLVGPAIFHYVGYFDGFGLDQPARILSGG